MTASLQPARPFLAPDGNPIKVVERYGRRIHSVESTSSQYDFEWCRRDGCHYWHDSGGGPYREMHDLGRLIPAKPEIGRVWVMPGVRLVHQDRWNKKAQRFDRIRDVTDALAFRLGWKIVRRRPRNPFDGACGDEKCVECERCGYIPETSDTPCDHLVWCNDCCSYVYREGRKPADDWDKVCAHELDAE